MQTAGTDSGAPFQRIEELKQENEVLRERLEQVEEDIERLRRENEELHQEWKAAGRGTRHGKGKPRAHPKQPVRKAGPGRFTFRPAPQAERRARSRRSKCRCGSPHARALGGVALGVYRRGDGYGYAAGRATGREELRGGGAALPAVPPAATRTTPGGVARSVWGHGASG
jgi:hypothetical protein